MKKIFYLGIAMTMALASCSNEELVNSQDASVLEASVETESVSRVGFDKANKWAFYWNNGDQIWVNTGKMWTSDPDKSKTASFKGYGVNTTSGYAVYPYELAKENVSGSTLTLNLPEEYNYTELDADFFASSQNVPMSAKVYNGKASFKHLGAVAAFKFNDWELTGDHTFTLTTSKKITGEFTVDLSADTPEYTTNTEGQDVVTVNFTRAEDAGKGSFVIYIPIPTGTYDINLSMSVDGEEWYAKEVKNKTINRTDIVWLEVGESTLEGDSNDFKSVTAVNDVTDEVLTTSSEKLTVAVTEEVTGTNNTITIPAGMETEETTFSFTSVAEGAAITIENASDASYAGKIVIEIPENETIPTVTATVPDGEVYIKQGTVETLVVQSAENTTIIGAKAKIGTLTVNKGNVRLENGATVTTINRGNGNTDEVTVVTFEGEMPTDLTVGDKFVFLSETDGEVVAKVSSAEALVYALTETSIDKIVLTDDIEVAQTLYPKSSKTIDGASKTLSFTTYGDGRMIDVVKETEGASLTLKDITLLNKVSWIQRGVNYNTCGTLTLENVTIQHADNCSMNYAVNLPGVSNNCTVVINNCNIGATANALNIWGQNIKADVTNSHLYVIDNSEKESYSVIALNNDGAGSSADGTVVNVTGGSLKATGTHAEGSDAVRNNTTTGVVNISTSTEVVGEIEEMVAIVYYEGSTDYYSKTTLAGAIQTARETNAAGIRLIRDIELDADETIKIANGEEFVIYMNNHTVTGISDETGANRNMFDVQGTLTLKNGTMTIEHKGTNMGWNNSTNVFNVTAGGVLNLEDATIENLGGSDMAFCVHLNNWGEVTLNAKNTTFKSTYVGIRAFNSGNDMNNVTLDGCNILTGNSCFWVHNYTAADFGNSTEKAAAAAARLNLNFSNTTIARTNGSESLIRFGFTNSIYYSDIEMTNVIAGTSAALTYAAANGKNIKLLNDIELSEVLLIGYDAVIDGNGKTLTTSANRAIRLTASDIDVEIKNLNIVSTAPMVYPNDVRGIAIDTNLSGVELALNQCTVDFTDSSTCDWTYGVNVAGNTSGIELTINGGTYEGANVVNIWGNQHTINIDGATLNSTYKLNAQYSGVCVKLSEGTGHVVTIKNTEFNSPGGNAMATEDAGSSNTITQENNTDNTETATE